MTTTSNTTNDTRLEIVAEGKKAMAAVRDGANRVENGLARLTLAIREAMVLEHINAPPKTATLKGIMERIHDVGAFFGVVVKGQGKADQKYIMALRRALPCAVFLVHTDASLLVKAGKSERRMNAAGMLLLSPVKECNPTDAEVEDGIAERSVNQLLGYARAKYEGENTGKSPLVKAMEHLTNMLDGKGTNEVFSSEVQVAAFNNLLATMRKHLDNAKAVADSKKKVA